MSLLLCSYVCRFCRSCLLLLLLPCAALPWRVVSRCHVVTSRHVVSCVERLLDAKAELNRRDKRGHTALFSAVLNHSQPAVVALLRAGADVNFTYEVPELQRFAVRMSELGGTVVTDQRDWL
jgi:ankyrin repeat protein